MITSSAKAKPSRLFTICIPLFFTALLPYAIVSAEETLDLPDIISGIEWSNKAIKDYQLTYKTTLKFLYKMEFDKEHNRRSLQPLSRRDTKKTTVKEVFCVIEGDRWFYEQDTTDNRRSTEYSSKHAFDGEKELHFYNRNEVLSGSVKYPDPQPFEEVVTYDRFFTNLRKMPILYWLIPNEEQKQTVTMRPEMEVVQGTPCYVIESKGSYVSTIFWISPHHGFRPVRMDYIRDNGTRYSYIVTKFKEATKEIWFPTQGRFEVYKKTEDSSDHVMFSVLEMEVDASTIRVNFGIDDDQFQFAFPDGTQVHNDITKKLYKVGAIPKKKKTRPPIYETDGKGMARAEQAIAKAKRSNKRVLLLIGGNWCGWCYRLHSTIHDSKSVRTQIEKSYILVMIDNKADNEVLNKWDIQPKGYPYLAIVDAYANKLTEQETGSLVVDGMHDPKKLVSFLVKWQTR